MFQLDFELVAGDARTLTIHILNADGTPTNVDGASFTWGAVRDTVDDPAVEITKTSDEPTEILIETPTTGIVSIYIEGTDTEDLESGIYQHVLRMISANGEPSTIFNGSLTVLPALPV